MTLDREEDNGYSLHYETTGAKVWFTPVQTSADTYRTNFSGNFHIDFFRNGKQIDYADWSVDADGKMSEITTNYLHSTLPI